MYVGNAHVATYTDNTTYFISSDWLGNARVLTGPTGAVLDTCTNLPFGDGQNCTATTQFRDLFTGQEHDSESDQEHFWFRQYFGTHGRWTSPDPAGMMAANPANPQSWNRYAYASNSPINFTDALGLEDSPLDGPDGPCLFDDCGGGGPDCPFWFDPFCGPDGPIPFPPPGGSGGGGGGGGGPHGPRRGGGVTHRGPQFPNGETLGIPNGLSLKPGSLWSLFFPTDNNCEFGSCIQIATGLTDCCSSGVCSAACTRTGTAIAVLEKELLDITMPVIAATVSYFARAKDRVQGIPRIDQLQLNCKPGRTLTYPATGRAYTGGTVTEQEYICSYGVYTIQTITVGGKVVHMHVRPGPPKGPGGGDE